MDLKITPSGQTIVKPTALGPVANTDTKLLIYGLFQKDRVLAQDGVGYPLGHSEGFREWLFAHLFPLLQASPGATQLSVIIQRSARAAVAT